MELFDICDSENNLLGKTITREEAHRTLAYYHRTTAIWIFNDDKKILCQKRSIHKDLNAGKWQSFFGGHVKAGENYDQNTLSELEEELGLRPRPEELVPIFTYKNLINKHFTKSYILIWNGKDKELSFNDGEVEEVKWFTLSEVQIEMDKGVFCNSLKPQILEYINNLM